VRKLNDEFDLGQLLDRRGDKDIKALLFVISRSGVQISPRFDVKIRHRVASLSECLFL